MVLLIKLVGTLFPPTNGLKLLALVWMLWRLRYHFIITIIIIIVVTILIMIRLLQPFQDVIGVRTSRDDSEEPLVVSEGITPETTNSKDQLVTFRHESNSRVSVARGGLTIPVELIIVPIIDIGGCAILFLSLSDEV